MKLVQQVLKDPLRAQFAVVTIPTALAVVESRRLINSLQGEGIAVTAVLCNQVIAESAGLNYIETRSRMQRGCIKRLTDAAFAMKAPDGLDVAKPEITEVPYCDTEIVGVYGLRYFATLAHPPKARTATNPIGSRKITIFGGKGGVGKTTSAASWAMQLSDAGLRTLVVSTDPAHSLGDALGVSLSGLPTLIDSGVNGEGELWALEVDPASALEEFKEIVGKPLESGGTKGGKLEGMLGGMGMGLPDLKAELGDMLGAISGIVA